MIKEINNTPNNIKKQIKLIEEMLKKELIIFITI